MIPQQYVLYIKYMHTKNTTIFVRRYNLDISLFERMVRNGMHCNVLTTQHRMRPEISLLMRHIYTDLQDHPSVCDYDNIRGIRRNIFFIDHRYFETENKELRSHSNKVMLTLKRHRLLKLKCFVPIRGALLFCKNKQKANRKRTKTETEIGKIRKK